MGRYRLTILFAALLVTPSASVALAQAPSETPPASAELTAQVRWSGMSDPGTPEPVANGRGLRGVVERYAFVDSSDPRFSGTIEWYGIGDMHEGVPGFDVWQGTFRVDNDDGTWEGLPTTWLRPPGAAGSAGVTSVLVGTGAYEGWTAVVVITGNTTQIAGVIFEGELPPNPDPPSR